jgi:protein-tyrosine-phosphatase
MAFGYLVVGRGVSLLFAASLVVSGVTFAAFGLPQETPKPPASAAKPTTVLFMCPHGSARSVLASAYFQKLAKERGLNVRVDSAGMQPDAVVGPVIAEHLMKNGYAVPIVTPRAVTPGDLATADVVISLGCDLTGLPAPRGTLQQWNDVPGPSENLAGADEAIRQHVAELVEELLRRPK